MLTDLIFIIINSIIITIIIVPIIIHMESIQVDASIFLEALLSCAENGTWAHASIL